MTYFKINDIDFSMYVNSLSITKNHIYKSQVNAAGNTIVKKVNVKRIINVGIIPLDAAAMKNLQTAIDNMVASISFQNPETAALETISCMIPTNSVDYYTIRGINNTSFKAFSLQFTEL